MEIAHDIWMLEVDNDTRFSFEPPFSNVFIMRDNERVLVLDTGCSGIYQGRLLEILRRFAGEGAEELIFMLNYGHWVHPQNKKILNQAGYGRIRFLLPEPEFRNLNILTHMQTGANHIIPDDLVAFVRWIKNFVAHRSPRHSEIWKIIQAMPIEYNQMNDRTAWESVLVDILCPELNSFIVNWAEPVSLENRTLRWIDGERMLFVPSEKWNFLKE